MKLPFILIFFLLISSSAAIAQKIIHIDKSATGMNDGSSWEDAFMFLQDGLQAASSGDEVWVAAGVYHPDEGAGVTEGDRDTSFVLINNVGIYGGFAGHEAMREERDWEINKTILSGDLLENDNKNITSEEPNRIDNSGHVVRVVTETDTTAILNGFIIEGGHAVRSTSGGGMVIDFSFATTVRLKNLIFQYNYCSNKGGGLANEGGSISLSNVQFINNTAAVGTFNGGGGLYHRPAIDGEIAFLDEVYFESNSAKRGGAIYAVEGSIFVSKSIFYNNFSLEEGGAVSHNVVTPLEDAEAIYANVIFIGNTTMGFGGGAISNEQSTSTFINALFSGNEAIDNGGFNVGGLGGARIGIEGSETIIIQSTFANNKARTGGSVASRQNGDFHIYNSILWGNQAEEAATFDFDIDQLNQDSLSVGFSLLELQLPDNAFDVGGILIGDPGFINLLGQDGIAGTLDDDLRLSETSIAIDAGDNSRLPFDILDLDQDSDTIEVLPIDLDENVRIYAANEAIVDLGAYEYNSSIVSNEKDYVQSSKRCSFDLLAPAYPNPFSNSTESVLCVNDASHIRVALYDLLGRQIKVFLNAPLIAGNHYPISISGSNLANGMYFLIAESTNQQSIQRIVLLR